MNLPDDIIHYLLLNILPVPTIENFILVDKRIYKLYREIISNGDLKKEFDENHYDIVEIEDGCESYLKGTNIKWGFWCNVDKSGYYRNDIKVGQWELYEDGEEAKGEIIDDLREGSWTIITEYDGTYIKGNYIRGKREGEWRQYDLKTDILKKIIVYINDELISLETFNKYGQLLSKHRYSESESNHIKYHLNGNIMLVGNDYDGFKSGIWERFHPNGKLRSRVTFKEDERDGLWERFTRDGVLMERGMYDKGRRVGCWEFINPSLNGNNTRTY